MDDGVERLDTEPVRPPGGGVWVATVLVAVLVVTGVVLDGRSPEQSLPLTPTPTPSRSSPTAKPTPSLSASPSPSPKRPVSIQGTESLAAQMPAGKLYALSAGALFAIDPTTGTVVRTDGIDMGRQNPVSMVPTDQGVVLQPTDSTAGRFVQDGKPATELAGELKGADVVLPGPDGNVWAVSFRSLDDAETTVRLADAGGRRIGPLISDTGSFSSDGGGGLLVSNIRGVRRVHPGPVRQISTGSISGTGPHSFWLLECDTRNRCGDTLLDLRTGRRAPLPLKGRTGMHTGLISADAAFMVVETFTNDGRVDTQIIRLSDGTIMRSIPVSMESFNSTQGLAVWLSARWLALIDQGRIVLYDTTTDELVIPDLPVDEVVRLAWRLS